jgi:ribose-phosphate pyrophosphokinase
VESATTTTTELTRLPGLEVAETKPELKPEHWIERGPSKRLMLFAGRSHPDLAQRIAEKLGIQLGDVEFRTFANGETYCRYQESIRGADMFIVQTGYEPVDRNLMELLIMIDAAKLASARRITAVLPYSPYARQDKKSRPREPITAKLVAEMLQTAGADRVLTMDLHAGQVQGFFEIPVDHMTALPLLAQYFRDLGLPNELVAVAPDTGRTRLAGKFAEMIGGDLVVLQKDRPAHNVARITNIIGDVEGKCAVLTDDMIDTAGTLVAGADAIKAAGATKVLACATHGLFSGPAFERIVESALDLVVVTDTVPVDPLKKPESVTVLPISDILAETIHNVFADDSVSAIFGDMNALF